MKALALACACLMAALGAAGQPNPVKVATAARFDMEGDAQTGSFNFGYLTAGAGSLDRETWVDPSAQTNTYTINFNVPHFAWSAAAFRFTPQSNGTVTLTLRGPWEQSTNGAIYKQEVLWDACAATGTTLTNGSFENVSGGIPLGWWRTYGADSAADTGPVAAFDGTRYIRVWHDSPMSGRFAVAGGTPVTLQFHARAVFPTNFPEMARITGTNTPAHGAARKFMRGANMANYLETPPGGWTAPYSANDFANMRREGFDHVRVPAAWNFHAGGGPAFTIDPAFFGQVDFVVTNALNAGLSAIVNIHGWDEFATNATANSNEFYAIWTQIAAHYANTSTNLAFELVNEPYGPGATTAMINPIYAEAIRRIRLTNPGRTIFVGPSQWNGIGELGNLLLSDRDSNLIVTVHCYDPFYFTHQGATWTGPDTATTGVIFPAPPAVSLQPAAGIGSYVSNWFASYNTLPADGNPSSALAFSAEQQWARQWSDYYGRPVHIGEFGAFTTGDAVSRANFYRAFRSGADALGLGWAIWDWNSGFHYWDTATGAPAPGMREALFPAPAMITCAPGRISFAAAVAKTFRIDRRFTFDGTTPWRPLFTNSLTTTNFSFSDPEAGASNAAYYRAYWVK